MIKSLNFGEWYDPFCVQSSWQHHARLYRKTYPLGAKEVLEQCYLDEPMPSAPTVNEAKGTTKKPTQLGHLAGFHIPKWISSELDMRGVAAVVVIDNDKVRA